MKYVKIKPLIVSGQDISDMTIAYYTDEDKMSYYDAYMNYIGRTHKCNVVCNLNTALKFTPEEAKRIGNNNTISFDCTNISQFKHNWGGRAMHLLDRAKEIVIHNLKPLEACWVVQELHLFINAVNQLNGFMLETTIKNKLGILNTYRLIIKLKSDGVYWYKAGCLYTLVLIDNDSGKDIVENIKSDVEKEELIFTIKELFKDHNVDNS